MTRCALPFFLAAALAAQAPSPPDAHVLIVGAGIAGLSAALEAGRGGAVVTVVDLSSVFGGHAVVSGGNVAIVGTPLQESQKIKDTPDLAYQDFIRWGEDADPAWVRYYVDNSRQEIYEWLTAMGVAFHVVAAHDGNSVPRLHFTKGKGLALVSPIYRECLRLPNVRFVWNTRVTELLVDGGRVTGVAVEDLRSKARLSVRARAVILATGGFQSNLAMVEAFWPKHLPRPPRLLAGAGHQALGAGHAIAQKAGAVLHNMDHQWNYALGLPDPRDPSGQRGLASFNPAAIWVNARGRRFVNEFAGAKDSLPAMLAQPGSTYWSVFDEAGKRSFGVTLAGWEDFARIEKLIFANPEIARSAPTLKELAAKAGMPPAALVKTVARYNTMVAKGTDRDFRRFTPRTAPKPARIEKPPFYAVQFFPNTRKSMGGIQVDRSCRVLDRDQRPIPGLYAVGELAGFGGINGKAALEGTFLGPSILMGRVASRAILAGLTPPAASRRTAPRAEPAGAADDRPCASCHDVAADLAAMRSGFWHYEKSHAVVLERNYECGACHAELAPYRRGAHRIDRLAQINNCAWCHGARP